jgi:hypothetical protein
VALHEFASSSQHCPGTLHSVKESKGGCSGTLSSQGTSVGSRETMARTTSATSRSERISDRTCWRDGAAALQATAAADFPACSITQGGVDGSTRKLPATAGATGAQH